ncbi:MAG: transglycosylase domain-containing protein, partial [Clostridia bacterium]|nr:transglycosylase domain-containing protein [Clostridia bacterium]
MKFLKKLFLCLLGGVAIAALGCFVYYQSVTASVKLNTDKLNTAQESVTLFDGEGNPVSQCSFSGKSEVSFGEIPSHTVNAFLAAEDKNFFSHHGFDYKRMAMALFKNITSFSFKEGASTISQQLVKNTQLSPEKTIKRKLRELKLTKELEKKYGKEEILEMYLNTIYFGHGCFGLESAARFYFNRLPAELSLGQSAVLSGLIKSPNNYSPFKKPENCLKRRNFILKVMQENGYIDASEREKAENEPLPIESARETSAAQCYYSAVMDELEELIGEEFYGGLKVYTFLDVKLQ